MHVLNTLPSHLVLIVVLLPGIADAKAIGQALYYELQAGK